MSTLGAQKQTLLNQVKNQTTIPLKTLVDLINKYEDLEPRDFQGYIDDTLLEQLIDASRNPEELDLWNQILNTPRDTPENIQEVQGLVSKYIQQYPKAPQIKFCIAIKLIGLTTATTYNRYQFVLLLIFQDLCL